MKARKIGNYDHKGTQGIYVEIIGISPARYAVVDWAMLPDEQFSAIRRGELFEMRFTETFPRIDMCLE